jgi:hypothetical protein
VFFISNDTNFFFASIVSSYPQAPSHSPTISPTPVPTITRRPTPGPTTIPDTCSGPSELGPGERLYAEREPSFICSPNGKYRFGMTWDGDLTLWAGKTKVWSAGTCCKGSDAFVAMQRTGGNLVVRSYVEIDSEDDVSKAHWSSGTSGNPNAMLRLDDDGQSRIISAGETILWETDVVHPVPTEILISAYRSGEVPPTTENATESSGTRRRTPFSYLRL